ncbi:hypothetical protein RF11_02973 [Thelohanellus kitauei]|uniref:Uncharacterized protein n=1 Tax=Thelohanellus kitauei TaxID=669202 RepID=A0A0C2NBD0_THEKT|nr:hypothetical protein RF11_02973 [Thelohanellus kitauei]
MDQELNAVALKLPTFWTTQPESFYGYPLTVPGESVDQKNQVEEPPIHKIREKVHSLHPIPTSKHGSSLKYKVPQNINECEFVFLRNDSSKTPLQRPYSGPFTLINKSRKTFEIDIGGRTEVVSIDRLKPAHIDVEFFSPAVKPKRGRPPKLKCTKIEKDDSKGGSWAPCAPMIND